MVGVHNPLAKWKLGELPANPVVQLILNQNLGERNGFPILSSTLASDAEIDEAVAQWVSDLKRAASEAKRTLRRQHEKMIASPAR